MVLYRVPGQGGRKSECKHARELVRQCTRMVLYLLEPRQTASLALNVLDQRRNDLELLAARPLWAAKLVAIARGRVEMGVESGQVPECAVAQVAFVGANVVVPSTIRRGVRD